MQGRLCEDSCDILGYDTVQSGVGVPTSRRNKFTLPVGERRDTVKNSEGLDRIDLGYCCY